MIKHFLVLAIRCVEQAAPANGNVVCTDGGNLNSVCQFTCNRGYNLIGGDSNSCFDDRDNDAFGQWTSPPPFCQRKSFKYFLLVFNH